MNVKKKSKNDIEIDVVQKKDMSIVFSIVEVVFLLIEEISIKKRKNDEVKINF